ncbi:hypothetical protein [Litchfieldia salsa]|uniref:Uncharacterized protein n=1 Tax=Litchfieldia salsa TaxID=930152 RepID=A0A1H0SNS9_9BACI|nr:hypothetical protein [Litchfieldia salsa]SDP42846.1 hypothetical protein SAMN05216565_10313 [Litchfieldia salsa]
MSEMTTSIVLYGEIDEFDTDKWIDFYNISKDLSKKLSFEPNYIGLDGEEFKSGKVLTVKRTEKRLLKSLANRKSLLSMSLYSLPEDFTQAAFDYNLYLGRDKNEDSHNQSKIILTIPTEVYRELNTPNIIATLKEFIQFKEGEIFELSRYETPLLYASRLNEIEYFETLKILSTF